jgi:hypothetical protein
MFFIPGFIVALLTFPGVVVHEIAHRLFCDIAGVPVYEACYIRFGSPAGYVIHGPVKKLGSAFLIAVGPFIINTLLCAIISFPAVVIFEAVDDFTSPLNLFLLWMGISIGMHAFPSKEDLDNFYEAVKSTHGFSPLLAFSFLLSFIFKIARFLSIVWFDAIYAIMVAMILPTCLL